MAGRTFGDGEDESGHLFLVDMKGVAIWKVRARGTAGDEGRGVDGGEGGSDSQIASLGGARLRGLDVLLCW